MIISTVALDANNVGILGGDNEFKGFVVQMEIEGVGASLCGKVNVTTREGELHMMPLRNFNSIEDGIKGIGDKLLHMATNRLKHALFITNLTCSSYLIHCIEEPNAPMDVTVTIMTTKLENDPFASLSCNGDDDDHIQLVNRCNNITNRKAYCQDAILSSYWCGSNHSQSCIHTTKSIIFIIYPFDPGGGTYLEYIMNKFSNNKLATNLTVVEEIGWLRLIVILLARVVILNCSGFGFDSECVRGVNFVSNLKDKIVLEVGGVDIKHQKNMWNLTVMWETRANGEVWKRLNRANNSNVMKGCIEMAIHACNNFLAVIFYNWVPIHAIMGIWGVCFMSSINLEDKVAFDGESIDMTQQQVHLEHEPMLGESPGRPN